MGAWKNNSADYLLGATGGLPASAEQPGAFPLAGEIALRDAGTAVPFVPRARNLRKAIQLGSAHFRN